MTQAPDYVLVPREPVCGKRYEAGDWSRRNYEAFMEDQSAAPKVPDGEQQVREAFERWAADNVDSSDYRNFIIAWRVWQAAIRWNQDVSAQPRS